MWQDVYLLYPESAIPASEFFRISDHQTKLFPNAKHPECWRFHEAAESLWSAFHPRFLPEISRTVPPTVPRWEIRNTIRGEPKKLQMFPDADRPSRPSYSIRLFGGNGVIGTRTKGELVDMVREILGPVTGRAIDIELPTGGAYLPVVQDVGSLRLCVFMGATDRMRQPSAFDTLLGGCGNAPTAGFAYEVSGRTDATRIELEGCVVGEIIDDHTVLINEPLFKGPSSHSMLVLRRILQKVEKQLRAMPRGRVSGDLKSSTLKVENAPFGKSTPTLKNEVKLSPENAEIWKPFVQNARGACSGTASGGTVCVRVEYPGKGVVILDVPSGSTVTQILMLAFGLHPEDAAREVVVVNGIAESNRFVPRDGSRILVLPA